VGNTRNCSSIVSLGSSALDLQSQCGLAFQKVNFGLWGFSKFEFRPTGSFQNIRGVSVLDGVEDASEETLRFGSWSRAYIKLGAPSVRNYFNKTFRLKSDMCASAVVTPANVL
jgi:hypothetical protein